MHCTLSGTDIDKMVRSCIQLSQKGEEKGLVERDVHIEGFVYQEIGFLGVQQERRES